MQTYVPILEIMPPRKKIISKAHTNINITTDIDLNTKSFKLWFIIDDVVQPVKITIPIPEDKDDLGRVLLELRQNIDVEYAKWMLMYPK